MHAFRRRSLSATLQCLCFILDQDWCAGGFVGSKPTGRLRPILTLSPCTCLEFTLNDVYICFTLSPVSLSRSLCSLFLSTCLTTRRTPLTTKFLRAACRRLSERLLHLKKRLHAVHIHLYVTLFSSFSVLLLHSHFLSLCLSLSFFFLYVSMVSFCHSPQYFYKRMRVDDGSITH